MLALRDSAPQILARPTRSSGGLLFKARPPGALPLGSDFANPDHSRNLDHRDCANGRVRGGGGRLLRPPTCLEGSRKRWPELNQRPSVSEADAL